VADSASTIKVALASEETFAALQEPWSGLLARSPAASPMLTWEWVYSWWEAYREHEVSRTFYLLIARDGRDELKGVLPLVLRSARSLGVTVSRLEFMGTGEPFDDETCSEFLDALVDPDSCDAVLQAFADYLASDPSWDEILWRDVADSSPGAAAQRMALLLDRSAGSSVRHTKAGACPRILLPESWDAYMGQLTPKRAKRIAYERRRLGRDHDVRFRVAKGADASESLADFRDLHQSLWQSRGKKGCFSSSVFDRFLTSYTQQAWESGNVRVCCLDVDGEPLAVFYAMSHGKGLYYYNSGVVPDRFERYSLGNIALGHMIEYAIEQGYREFHFFKGNPASYKQHWASGSVGVSDILIRRGRPHMLLLEGFERGRRVIRAVRNRKQGNS
jgi:CelD/BcsL family acetyltransferase involved in cellulose biosynthesis